MNKALQIVQVLFCFFFAINLTSYANQKSKLFQYYFLQTWSRYYSLKMLSQTKECTKIKISKQTILTKVPYRLESSKKNTKNVAYMMCSMTTIMILVSLIMMMVMIMMISSIVYLSPASSSIFKGSGLIWLYRRMDVLKVTKLMLGAFFLHYMQNLEMCAFLCCCCCCCSCNNSSFCSCN